MGGVDVGAALAGPHPNPTRLRGSSRDWRVDAKLDTLRMILAEKHIQDIAGDHSPENFREFLQRIYNQFHNVGVSPQDRAMNYSAFNAYNTKKIFQEMARRTPNPMVLDTVSVDRSTICRPDADCWDVTWTFFDPSATLTTARKVFQYTVDVSDVVPVTVGPLRDWMIF